MSRNSRRTTISAPSPDPTSIKKPTNNSNPFGINLVAATEVVKLPSGGKMYPEYSTLHNITEVEIKHMTAREEDLLSNSQFLMDGTIFDRLLASILVDKSIDPMDFTAADRMAIIYAARITGYGSEYVMKMDCGACGKNAEFVFDISKQEIVRPEPEDVSFDETTGHYEFKLPKTGLKVKLRLLSVGEEAELEKQAEKANSLGISNNNTVNLFRKSIISVDDVEDIAALNQLYENLPALDCRKIRSVINGIAPHISTLQTVACGSCGTESESEVPFSLGFFWPDV